MKHVIIVEDHLDHAYILSATLTKVGFLTTSSMDIFKILDQIQQGTVDAIILDIHLPGMIPGDEIISMVRNVNKQIPIVMTTGLNDDYMRIRCLELGANYYFVKPIALDDLISVFKQWI